jgi:hypothetical protein
MLPQRKLLRSRAKWESIAGHFGAVRVGNQL